MSHSVKIYNTCIGCVLELIYSYKFPYQLPLILVAINMNGNFIFTTRNPDN